MIFWYYIFIIYLNIVSHCSSEEDSKLKNGYLPLEVLRFPEHYRVKRSAENAPQLRITPLYSRRFGKSIYAEEIKKSLVEPTIKFWSGILKAKNPSSGPLVIPRKCKIDRRIKVEAQDGSHQTYCAEGCEEKERCYMKLKDEWLDECREMKDGKIEVTKEKGTGLPETDFILVVDSFQHSACKVNVNAISQVCSLESTLDRPVIGYVNICPARLLMVPPESVQNLMLMKHEVAHVLGFADTVAAFMREEGGQPRTPRDEETGLPSLGREDDIYIPSDTTVKKITRQWKSATVTTNITLKSLVTPSVLEAARNHYDCQELDGVDLEEDSFHFQRKNMIDEVLVAQGSLVHASAMTFGFFKDTGWYHVEMSKADQLLWGKGLGCTFVKGSCYEYMEEQQKRGGSMHPWCNDVSEKNDMCVGYANAHGWCNLVRYKKVIPEKYRYFKHLEGVPNKYLKYYGGDMTMKYCPYIEAKSPCLYDFDADVGFRKDNDLLEEIGNSSMCFNHTAGREWTTSWCRWSSTIGDKSSSCRKFQCVENVGLVLQILGSSFNCPVQGGSLKISAASAKGKVSGELECPACKTVCQSCPDLGR